MAHSIGSCLIELTICCSKGTFSSLRGPYLASCRARADRKGVGVRGDDSMMERQMVGVLNISFSFCGLIRGLESTGEFIGKLSLSECSGLIDWLRNCEGEKGRFLTGEGLGVEQMKPAQAP